MIRNLPRIAAACLALASGAAGASGSLALGSGPSGVQQLYNAGKAVFAQRLACNDCRYSGRKLDSDLARALLATPAALGMLDPEEQDALRTYLNRRFGISG